MTSEATPASLLIDTHCHLDDPSFSDDLDDVLSSSRDAGVVAWIMVGFSPTHWNAAVRMSSEIPGMAHILGVHPGHAGEWNDDVRRRLADALVVSKARGLGEIGLDFYRDNAPLEIQERALVEQLDLARELDLPVVFHMRDAEPQMLDILERQQVLPRMVFHSFDGTARLTRFILEYDAYVGVGGLATRMKSETLREQLRDIPLSRMVLETDSPYLVPARQKDRRNTPANVPIIAQFLAGFLDCPVEEVARQTTSTAESIFGSLLP